MSRPREFEVEDVLEKTMQVFWSQGFRNTSIDDLMDATNLSRSSLYNAFGSKHELFLIALDRYIENSTGSMVKRLDGGVPAREAASETLHRIADSLIAERAPRGCFLCNSANEMAPIDPDSARRVSGGFQMVEDAYCRAIERDQKAGRLASDICARAVARFLVSSINGLRAVGKATPERAYLYDIVDTVLSVLRKP